MLCLMNTLEGANVIADLSHLRFRNIDIGYDPGAYGGMARAGTGPAPGLSTPIVGHKNEEGIEGVLALASLPLESVDRFSYGGKETNSLCSPTQTHFCTVGSHTTPLGKPVQFSDTHNLNKHTSYHGITLKY